MKILVFSDSHGSLNGMYWAIEEHNPDQVIFLGDVLDDIDDVEHVYPRLPVCKVPGNCDGWSFTKEPVRKCLNFWGKKILMAHGHNWPNSRISAPDWRASSLAAS